MTVASQLDWLGRDTVTITSAILPTQSYSVHQLYDAEGRLLKTSRMAAPDTLVTQTHYDAIGRAVKQIDVTGVHADSTVYDAAGNAITVVTRRGDIIATTFDLLNRRTLTTTDSVHYGTFSLGIDSTSPPEDHVVFGGLTISGDTVAFTYDAVGNVIEGDNIASHVGRTYNKNGLLQSEVQEVRSLDNGTYFEHVYFMNARYDLDGRQILFSCL